MEIFNACDYLVDRQIRGGRAERVALCGRGRTLTYAELLERVLGTAAGLAGLGVRPEGRVLLVLLDGAEFVASFLGAMRIGAIPVPVNPLLPGRDVGAVARDSRAQVAVMSLERIGVAGDLLAEAPELRDLVVVGEGEPGGPGPVRVNRFADVMTARADIAPHETWEDSPGFWLCTSGTTGQPKLAMHRHVDLRLTAEGYAGEVLGIGEEDRTFSVAPLFHAYGLGNAMSFPLSAGATTILDPTRPPTPELVAEIVRAERPTLFFSVPTFYAALLAADLPEETFASVRLAVSAGEALPAELFARFRERFGVEILDGIGSTEMTHIYVSNRRGRCRPGSSGTPVRGYRIRLVDDEGEEVGPMTPGQLLVSGESAAMGYWCRAEATRRSFRGEWFASGDMYVRSEDGFYTYLGRADDMLKVGGEWVSPAEVESVLVAHADVLEAVVVGEPRPDGLIQPVAYVVEVPGHRLDGEALIEHCRGRLAGFKRPRRVVVVEGLPKTATGKIQRAKVRELAEQGALVAAG